METFIDRLLEAQREKCSHLCIGFDPDLEKMPKRLRGTPRGHLEFSKRVLDAVAQYACIIKPNHAFWACIGAEDYLRELIRYAHDRHGLLVILDGKRGDIGNTAKFYAMECFDRYHADAATVNAYLGCDTLEPWLAWGPSKAIFALCHTSNKGAGDFQDLEVSPGLSSAVNTKLYLHLARKVTSMAKPDTATVGLVAGATFPRQISSLDGNFSHEVPYLIPGIGKQGGDLAETIKNIGNHPFVVNSSSGIIHASQEDDFAQAAAREAEILRNQIEAELAAQ